MTERIVKNDPTEPVRVVPPALPAREPKPGKPLPATFTPGRNPAPIKRR